jgi:hypothetical protein
VPVRFAGTDCHRVAGVAGVPLGAWPALLTSTVIGPARRAPRPPPRAPFCIGHVGNLAARTMAPSSAATPSSAGRAEQRHIGAVGCERARDRSADAPAGAGHEGVHAAERPGQLSRADPGGPLEIALELRLAR